MTRAFVAAALLGVSAASIDSAPQPELGVPLDRARFAYQRTIPDGPPGPVAVVVDPPALAHSRGPDQHFADVRILDGSNRQVPYVIERRDEPLVVPLPAERADPPASSPAAITRSNWSSYRLRLPCANLPPAKIEIETSARVFQRGVKLAVVRPPDRQSRSARLETMSFATWNHVTAEEPANRLRPEQSGASGDERADRSEPGGEQGAPPILQLSFAPGDVSELWLLIDEGDNTALPVTAVRLLLPSYRFRFYRPARSSLLLVYGRSDLLAPRYDLALTSQDLISAAATEVTPLGERQTQPTRRTLVSPLQFWLFLSIAVVVLLALIVRLARRSSDLA